jgi:hypothetical protein
VTHAGAEGAPPGPRPRKSIFRVDSPESEATETWSAPTPPDTGADGLPGDRDGAVR